MKFLFFINKEKNLDFELQNLNNQNTGEKLIVLLQNEFAEIYLISYCLFSFSLARSNSLEGLQPVKSTAESATRILIEIPLEQ